MHCIYIYEDQATSQPYPYNAKLNPIENLFSQIKNYVKDISPATYEELKITIYNIIKNRIKNI